MNEASDYQHPAYAVEIDWAPAFELSTSLQAFVAGGERAIMDLGNDWVRRVRRQIGTALADHLRDGVRSGAFDMLEFVIWRCPEDRSAPRFIAWLREQSPGSIYELIAPDVANAEDLRDLGRLHEQVADLLEAWNEAYFRHIDPAILEGLSSEAAAMRERAASASPREVVEAATKGADVVPVPGLDVVVLVPQYHYRPWNLYLKLRTGMLYKYPADVLPPAEGEPPRDLMRLTRALGDTSRLRILRFLAEGDRSFSEVVAATGLAKSTVHYHMVLLRAAGLVRLHEVGGVTQSYSLRPDGLTRLGPELLDYLTQREVNP